MKCTEAPDGYRWVYDPECLGVNAMTLGLWCEVINRWVGPVSRLAATAGMAGDQFTEDGNSIPSEIPSSLTVTGALDCGAQASYHLSNQAAFGPGDCIAIYGPHGGLVYRMFEDELMGASADDPELHPIEIRDEEVRLQTTDAEFVRAIREGTPVTPDFEEGIQYMKFCEAVAQSCHTGQVVELNNLKPVMRSWGKPL